MHTHIHTYMMHTHNTTTTTPTHGHRDNGGFGVYVSGFEHALWADADEDTKSDQLGLGLSSISSLDQAAAAGSPRKQMAGGNRAAEVIGSRRSAQGVAILPGKAFRVPRTTPHTIIHNIGLQRRMSRTGSLSPLGFSSSDSDSVSVGSMGSTLLRASSPGSSTGPQILLDLNIDLSSLETTLRSSASDPFLSLELSESALMDPSSPPKGDCGPASFPGGTSPTTSPAKNQRGFLGFVRGLSTRRRSDHTANTSEF
jgi:hypothetical protein